MTNSKSWYTSKLVWLNVATGLSLFFALPELQAILPANGVQYLLLAQASLNIFLRVTATSTLTK